MSPLCQQVVGTDISPAQIECAQQSPDNKTISNVEFKVASADQLPFSDGSVSMVTCAQAWHWFDPVTTYPEVCRILKFPGCLAILGYGQFLLKNTKCEKLFKEFCHRSIYLYRHPGSTPVDNLYHTINLPLPQVERCQWIIDCNIELPIFIRYLSTTSSWQRYCLAHPGTKLLEDLQEKLSIIIKEKIISLSYTVFLLLCLKQ